MYQKEVQDVFVAELFGLVGRLDVFHEVPSQQVGVYFYSPK